MPPKKQPQESGANGPSAPDQSQGTSSPSEAYKTPKSTARSYTKFYCEFGTEEKWESDVKRHCTGERLQDVQRVLEPIFKAPQSQMLAKFQLSNARMNILDESALAELKALETSQDPHEPVILASIGKEEDFLLAELPLRVLKYSHELNVTKGFSNKAFREHCGHIKGELTWRAINSRPTILLWGGATNLSKTIGFDATQPRARTLVHNTIDTLDIIFEHFTPEMLSHVTILLLGPIPFGSLKNLEQANKYTSDLFLDMAASNRLTIFWSRIVLHNTAHVLTTYLKKAQDLSEPLIWDTRPAGPLKGREHVLVGLSTATRLYLNTSLLVKMARRSLEAEPNGNQAWRQALLEDGKRPDISAIASSDMKKLGINIPTLQVSMQIPFNLKSIALEYYLKNCTACIA